MSVIHGTAGLRVGFYNSICPRAEATIKAAVQSRFNRDKTITPALLRLYFHDCFVQVSHSTSSHIESYEALIILTLTGFVILGKVLG